MAFAIRKPAGPQSDVAAAVLKHYEELRAFIRRKVGCPATAADLLQETYLRVATANAGASIENQRAYVYRVAGNLVTDGGSPNWTDRADSFSTSLARPMSRLVSIRNR